MPPKNSEEFSYTPRIFIGHDGKVSKVVDYPILRVRIKYKHTLTSTPVECLVDSGSVINLFPASWGELLKISIKSGQLQKIYGIGGISIDSYRHDLHLYIVDSKINFRTYAYFSEKQNTPLLGRYGFFDKFKNVSFNQDRGSFSLIK